MNHATPPSPPDNKDTDAAATTIKDESMDTVDMDSDNVNNTSTDSTEQVTTHNDDTTVVVESEVPSEPAVVENVKKEIVEEKTPPPSPPPPSPPKPVVPVEPPKQKTPSPPPQSTPRPEVTPPPAVVMPIKEEVPEPHRDVVATPQGGTKKKRGTPDGKKKAKASLQERRREQASDWIVDFCKCDCLVPCYYMCVSVLIGC